MKKKILRNVALVSAIFITTFSIMLIVNYFQVKGATPLQTEVIETLKEINDRNANNSVLQEQIRQLDLMARKAYFVRMNQLTTGVYILLGMLVVFIICTRLYFAKDKDIPDKAIDPIDEWAIKTKARRYVVLAATVIAAVALLFALLSAPFMRHISHHYEEQTDMMNEIKDNETANDIEDVAETDDETGIGDVTGMGENAAETVDAIEADGTITNAATETTVTATTETTSQPTLSNVTHNSFRGNNNNGISAAKGLPVKWDLANMTNIAWKQEVPRKGFNSPVINGNKVFFSGADEQARELFCYDLNTGKRLWSLAAVNIPDSPSKLPETSDDAGLASSSVATDGKKVCAVFATGEIICADMNGKQVWAKYLGEPDIFYGYTSSLLIYENTIIVQYDLNKTQKVMALDLDTGAERWSKSRNEKHAAWSSPMIASVNNTSQLVLMGNPGITAYNPNNGDQLWRVEGLGGEVAASACSADGIIFGGSDYAKLLAINGNDGSILWESTEFLPETSSPVATKNNLYLATSYGIIVSFDTKTGELRKEHDLEGSICSSPVVADGKVYQITESGKVCIFSADDEFRLLNTFDTGEKTLTTPAFTDGKIIVKTEKSIYCVGL